LRNIKTDADLYAIRKNVAELIHREREKAEFCPSWKWQLLLFKDFWNIFYFSQSENT